MNKMKKNLMILGMIGLSCFQGMTPLYATDINQVVESKLQEVEENSENDISKKNYVVQWYLYNLKYYNGTIDGMMNEETKQSIIKFQKDNSLEETGEINTATLMKLSDYEQKAIENEEKEYKTQCEIAQKEEQQAKAKEKAKQENIKKGQGAVLVDWFRQGQYLIPRKTYFTVIDVKTGKSFKAYRHGGTNHCDTEPASAKDTQIMKSIFGSWSWNRRPIVIITADGKYRIAASMAGMPHSSSHIKNNNFNGHFDIHLYNSKTHYAPANGVYTERVEPRHANAVKAAVGK